MICKSIYILKVSSETLKRNSSQKINVTKNTLFFFSLRAPTHCSLTLNSQFLYKLRHKVHLFKAVYVIFHFRFHLFFIKVYILARQKACTLSLQNVIVHLKIKILENSHKVLLPDLGFLSCNKKLEKSVISAWVGALQKMTWRRTF